MENVAGFAENGAFREQLPSTLNRGAIEGTRTPTPLRVHGPEPCASANSATMAQKNWDAAFFSRGRLPGRTTSNILQGESRLFKLQTAMENSTKPVDAVANLRALAHDLSNSLETVLQAAYLLQMARLDDRNKKWAQVIDAAARDAARINGEIRKILNAQG